MKPLRLKKFIRYTVRGTLATLAAMIVFWAAAAGAGDDPGGEIAGNNLSYPVIWAEGVAKTLPGTENMPPLLGGEWWYWWGTEGTEPNLVPLSCKPDPDDAAYCDDDTPGQATGDPPGEGWVKAYVQKDEFNVWQAGSADGSGTSVMVDWIDWGDNLESVDWYTRSQVRVEVVLFKTLEPPMLEYEMRHVSGWGIDEVHGLAEEPIEEPIDDVTAEVLIGPGDKATIYSHCARLTIQKLLVDPTDTELNLTWVPGEGWTEPDDVVGEQINSPIFNQAVHEAKDGPGYYNAEINVKGKVIYGYTWNVRKLNDQIVNNGEAAGYYRITFSFDDTCGGTTILNTSFEEGITEIMIPLEEELLTALAEETDGTGGGGTAVLDFTNNLTYIDVRILERTGGGGGNGNGGGGNGPEK